MKITTLPFLCCLLLVAGFNLNFLDAKDSFEPNNSLAAAKAMPRAGIHNNAEISSASDVDWFYFDVTADEPNVKIMLSDLPENYDLELQDASGTMIAQSTEMGLMDDVIMEDELAAGRYYVRVYSGSGAFVAGEGYRLIVHTRSETFGMMMMEEGDVLSDWLFFSSRMSGDQQVPNPVAGNAVGVGGFSLSPTLDTMCVNISVSGLTGPIIGAHIHYGEAGSNGGVAVGLTNAVNGNRIQTTLFSSDINNMTFENLLTEGLYVNVHTSQNAGGEIRGQVKLEHDMLYAARMDTNQQVGHNANVGTNDPQGLSLYKLSANEESLKVMCVMDDLTGSPIAAHLHYGQEGISSGPVAVGLNSFINGNVISGTVDLTDPGVPSDFLDSLKAGSIYIQIHTSQNTPGEIRGQLKLKGALAFESWLNTDQEVHNVTASTAEGVGYAVYSPDLDTLHYGVFTSGLSSTAFMAHIHQGEMGADGPALVNLSSGINGRWISGSATAGLTTDLLRDLLSGNAYFNLHTNAEPAGEVRGQVWKLARDGYDFDFSNAGAIPSTPSAGVGCGILSVDRERTNAHFMMVMSGLTSSFNAAHFHLAPAGQTGGVIFNLTPYALQTGGTDASAFGYFTEDDNFPTYATEFANDSVYVNVHTSNYPGGEIRGQVTNGTSCFTGGTNRLATNSGSTSSITQTASSFSRPSLYPNPSHADFVNIEFEAEQGGSASIRVLDMLARPVREVSLEIEAGFNQEEIGLEGLTPGMYLVELAAKGEREVMKLQIW